MREHRAGGRRTGCFKHGCFGCAGVLGLGILVAAVVAISAVVMGPPEREMVKPDVVRELPAPTPPRPGTASSDRGETEFPAEGLSPPPAQPGRLVLNLSGGEFEVVAGEPGEPIRIDGDYNAGAFELVENLEQGDDGGWTYEVTFRRKVSWIRMLHGDQHEVNRVRITIPRGVPMRLEGVVTTGVSDMDLGGLWLLEADLELGMGDHAVRFREPSPVPMDRFALEASKGSIRVDRLGNASPASVTARGSMGELALDLRGAWRNDAEVTARWTMGECHVRVPEDVLVESRGADVFLGGADLSALRNRPAPPPGAPTLKLSVTGALGEVRITR